MAGEHPRCGLFLPGFPEAVESSKGSPGGQFHGRVDGFGNGGPRHVAHQVSCSRGAGGDQRARGPTRRHLPHAARGSHPQPFRRSETGRAAARRAGDARVARHRAEESPYHGAPRLGAAAARSISAEVAAPHRRAGEDHLGSGGPDSAGRFHERVFSFDAKGGNPHHRRLRPSAAAREARRLLRNRMQIILFHLMPYADLDLEAGRKNGTVWVRLTNRHIDPEKGHRLYNRYLDELEHAERLGFDAVSVNEHHQTAYGLMPSPIVTASALARRTQRVRIAILGSALPLREHPLMVAEEHAMIDVISGGSLISGFVRGIGAEYHSFGVNPTFSHERFHEAHDLIVRAWTEPGPFPFQGKHYNVQYVNPWPRPYQKPHPPIWIPSQGSGSTIRWAARMRYTYCQTLSPIAAVARFFQLYRDEAGKAGYKASPDQLAWSNTIYVAETDERAVREARPHLEALMNYFLKMPTEMLLAPGYTDPASMKRVRAAKVTGKPQSIEDVIKAGGVIVGSPNTVREKLAEYQDLAGF